MNTSTMRSMIVTAALAVAAGSASAQTYKAEIPMSFRVGQKVMTPGSYELRLSTDSAIEIVYVRGPESTVMLTASSKSDAPKKWLQDGSPKLSFECVGGACSLHRLWNGRDDFTYDFALPKATTPEIEARRTSVVTLTMIKAH